MIIEDILLHICQQFKIVNFYEIINPKYILKLESSDINNLQVEDQFTKRDDSIILKDLKLIYKNDIKILNKNIYLISVLRDEELLLPYFIDYYKNIGIDQFILIENNSTDRSVEYIKSRKDCNIILFSTQSSYKENLFGTKWVNYILDMYCKNKWCIVVDIDELIKIEYENNLINFVNKLEKYNYNLVYCLLLDMYPKCINNEYLKGSNFLEHSNYYDKYIEENIEIEYLHNKSLLIKGGVRKRLFNLNCSISKIPIFKYTFYNFNIDIGCHLFKCKKCGELWKKPDKHFNNSEFRISPKLELLLHFKFIKPDLKNFFQKRINLNQDWNNSNEYKNYIKNFNENFYDPKCSIKYTNKQDCFLKISEYKSILQKFINIWI